MDDLTAIPGSQSPAAADDDPEVVAGMERLRLLREGESGIPEIRER